MGKSSTELSQGQRAARNKPRPALRHHARLGVILPLCIIVSLAILSIVVASFTSAQRANEVAVEHEKDTFVNAVAYRGEWSLRKLKTVIARDPFDDAATPPETDTLIDRVRAGSKTLFDHDFILVVDGTSNMLHAIVNADAKLQDMLPSTFAEIAPMLDFMRGRTSAPVGRITWLVALKRTGSEITEAVFMQGLSSGLPIIVSIALSPDDRSKTEDTGAPAVLALQLIDETTLAEIGSRLLLANLRKVDSGAEIGKDFGYEFRDLRGHTVARFAWTPQMPAAEVLGSVIPFIAIAIIGFAMLTAITLRFMRRSANEIADAEDQLRFLALHDPLCGLPNRIYFGDELESTITRVRAGGHPAAVLYIDLDHFKDVNDTLGHSIGDELIRSVSQRLVGTMRSDDLVARLGGDEFAVITTATADHMLLQALARQLITALCAPYTIQSSTIVIGASIGIATIGHETTDRATDILRYADIALYRAKSEGRNRACVYDTAMDADVLRRKQLEQDLRVAIENNQLQVVYQPVVNASGERIVGVEALARWPHPERGFISPIEFIPLAESSGLIIELGEWVLRRACLDGRAWPGLSLAVNVSPVQFRQSDFVETVERVVAETGFDPRRLELELTESTLIGNLEIAESAMLRLKAFGVRLALDDFGTGYSSLLYLRRFPFDKLKIDRSFVLSIEKTSDAAAIVHAIVSLGRGLGMKVTAEGVENAEQHLFLRAAGVHYMQGFRFGRPMDPSAITASLASSGAYRKIERDAVAAMAG